MIFDLHSSFNCCEVFHFSFRWSCEVVLYFHIMPSCLLFLVSFKGSFPFLWYPHLTLVEFARVGVGHQKVNAGPQLKTRLCSYFTASRPGSCLSGYQCRFAHGREQIGDARIGNAYPVEESWRTEFEAQWGYPLLEPSDVLTLGIFNRQAHFVFNRFVCL